MSVSLKSNTGSTFPRPLCQARWAPISLPSLPSRALGRDPEDSVLWLGPIPSREAPSLPASRLPTATDAGQPPPTGGGKPRPPQPPLPALLPSLPLSRPPSLSPSLARHCSRALPRATCSGPNPGISKRDTQKEKDLLCVEERNTRNCIYFSCSDSWRPLVTRPGHGSAAAEVCGACCLAHADRRALRSACSTLWAAALRPPKYQTDLKVLPTGSASGCLPRRWPPPESPLRSRLRPKSTRNSPCPCSRSRLGYPSLSRRPPNRTRAAALPRTANLPCTDPHKAQ